MANKTLFQSNCGPMLPKAGAVNEAGGVAYAFDAKHALAQYAATGCLNQTFYASAQDQLATVQKLAQDVEPEFIARTALFARQEGFMKDLPALLCAVLSVRSPGLLAEVFDRVIDSPKMLRNFVQIMRSGAVGRKSLGSLPKRLVQDWLASRSDEQVFFGSVGNDPSLADVIKMVHPKPTSPSREGLYAYLIGRDHNAEVLPDSVKAFERFKRARRNGNKTMAVPDVPFQLLTALDLTKRDWAQIARQCPWQTLRQALNTLARHGVFDDAEMVGLVANRLRDEKAIFKSRVLPYQLMVAYLCGSDDMPQKVRDALQDAMEFAIRNVPAIDGKVYVLPDVSGSMHSPITGYRKGSSSAVRCVDVAALVAAAVLRKNPGAEVIPFHDSVVKARLNPRDSVMTNARVLASLPSGGTNCSAPLAELNRRKAKGDLVIYVSDNESWVDSPIHGRWSHDPTATIKEWSQFKRRNPKAKMVCIDIQPYGSTQAQERADITNVGGFSDQVFRVIAAVARGETTKGYWVERIEQVTL